MGAMHVKGGKIVSLMGAVISTGSNAARVRGVRDLC